MTQTTTAPGFESQILRLRQVIDGLGSRVRTSRLEDPAGFARQVGLSARGQGAPSVVVGDEVGAELGRPPAPSHVLVLTTSQGELVDDGALRCLGELGQGPSQAVAQVVVLSFAPEQLPDRLELESTQFLPNRLPGYMVRTIPGRLWLRVSKEALRRGLGATTLGQALIAAYRQDFPAVRAVEVMLLCADEEAVRMLDCLAAEVKVLSGQHRKLTLVGAGEYECEDLDCNACDEKAICDALRDIRVRYRKGTAR